MRRLTFIKSMIGMALVPSICSAELSHTYLLIVIDQDINPAHQRDFEKKINRVIRGAGGEDYTMTNKDYVDGSDHHFQVTSFSVQDIAPDATDQTIEDIKKKILRPARGYISLYFIDSPFDKLKELGLTPYVEEAE